MAADRDRRESGQSLIEFMLMLPALLGMSLLMIRVNTAIQISIVDQKYARAQALWLTFNSPVYPARRFRLGTEFKPAKANQMTIGVSGNLIPENAAGPFQPEATVYTISRPGQPFGSNEPQKEPRQRGKVRVRNTVGLCTQVNWVNNKEPFRMIEGESYPTGICRSSYE